MLLFGGVGVKVMLTDDKLLGSPHSSAESAKKKTAPPPVARKPIGLMERISKPSEKPGQHLHTLYLIWM